MNRLQPLALAITLLVGGVSVATAQDFNKGLEATQSGDFETAVQEWRPLAEQGNADAQWGMGVLYDSGDGVPLDDAEAMKWYRLAAKQGFALAQYGLALLYGNGEGVPQNIIRAHMWSNIATANGDPDAGELREIISDFMTSADISKAQQMASECMSSNYQNCGY